MVRLVKIPREWSYILALLSTFAVLTGSAPWALAQVTSASLRGVVLNSKGEAVGEAAVVLEIAGSQAQKTSQTNTEGEFVFNGLKVGGPYAVKVSKAGLTAAERKEIFLRAGSNEAISLTLGAEVVKVTGARVVPVSSKKLYGESDIKNAPSTSGDPKDVARNSIDTYVDGNSMSIGGANNRFNSITVDGIRQDDDFGLNAGGYPTSRSPISLQSVAEISVERSPFDVRYGNFLGGNVNVVTKSGTNDFEGTVSTTWASGGLVGRKSKDAHYPVSKFSENRLGLTLGGPIIEDKLHFFLSVDGLKATTPSSIGPAGSGAGFTVDKVSVDDLARVQQISSQVYGFDAGNPSTTVKENEFKYLAKVDWTINDAHRLETKVQRSVGNQYNNGTATTSNLPLTSTWYNRTDVLDTYSMRLFSDWANDFSTKLELSKKSVTGDRDPLNGNDFMYAEVSTADKGKILLGPDRFSHTNKLANDTSHVGLEANYLVKEHQLTGGLDYDKTHIFNLFIPSTNGFATYASIDDFAAQKPKVLTYQNAVSNNPEDAAARWDYAVTALFAQDEWRLNSLWTARFGVRGEFYGATENIARNENFAKRYGYDNTSTLAGKQVLLPRLGLSYKATDRVSVRTGLGLYSGGTPAVWVSNAYTNTGVGTNTESSTPADGFNGREIPEAVKAKLQAGDGNVDALDPNFKIPQTWKFSLGTYYRFDIPSLVENVFLDFDYTYSKVRQGTVWKDLRRNLDSIANNQPTAYGPDGRALYDTDPSAKAASDFNAARGYDVLLTNTDKGYGQTASVTLSKTFASGLSLSGAYGWQNIFEIAPGTSSTSVSNYSQVAVDQDPNNLKLARSNYERTHRFLITTGYSHDFFAQLPTSFNLFLERRSGQPFSYTFGTSSTDETAGLFGEAREFASSNRFLFYVPKGDGSDVILDGIDEGEFNRYLSKTGLDKYRGRVAPRNAFTSNWIDVMDARMTQELPTANDKHKARLTFDLKNLPNLLNSRWGQVKSAPFPYYSKLVDVKYDAATGRYRYSNLDTKGAQQVRLIDSVWRLQLGAIYEF